MVEERSLTDTLVDLIIYGLLAVAAFLCLLPFLHVLALSFSSRQAVESYSVTIWPIGFNLANYDYLFGDQQFLRSFVLSIARVLIGVGTNLGVIVITAYPLSRDRTHMPGRTVFKAVMLFGMMFSGGLIPYYMALRNLGLLNNLLVLVIPPALNIFWTIIVINFFRGIPVELEEAALLDGATDFAVLFRVFVPLSAPVLATITLFSAVSHWNSWFDGIMFLARREMWPLQSYLYSLVTTAELERRFSHAGGELVLHFVNSTPRGLSAAFIFFATVPILMVYPLLQRYFVTGLTLGAVKQ